ncbi:carbohydrate ABC transporter permease [Caldicoprobacter faecalis]|uniref:Carbohydrate ABC transporter membrane protein 2, CUT1 family n=1 Tax=Caldicoprobacter faecalis TaxID=937334 RepID=A0A1I5YPA7_9FIRM|nr:carbohydrate ABC transporter permease [Caldicoprobacter faecalis]PZN07975.1 MAG: carbohydrate ABC transporter permease [Caldicoprobacter oshimai]SFQ45952.1 carbohydrate ABC transporter membrane protein 2, CUT1 family [Caldicoprobacter faecalis]
MRRKFLARRTKGEVVFDIVNTIIMIVICFMMLYPVWYTLVNSLNDGTDAMLGGIYWWPRVFSLDSYKAVFADSKIFRAFGVSFFRTIIGTTVHVFFTSMVAYGLSKKYLMGRKYFMAMGTITLFFSGGLIPTFLLYRSLGLLDRFAVYIIPAMFNFYNLLIFQAFFREIPDALEESAKIDGANDFYIFFKIIIPLSKPVLATIALFTGVYHWNDYFAGVIFINNPDLQPIQTFLYRVIAETTSVQMLQNMPAGIRTTSVTSQTIRLATMIVTTVPVVCVYPFLQKYFVKGMLLGSIKG